MKRTCSGPECDRHARANRDPALCQSHFYQWKKGRSLTPLAKPLQRDLICAFDGCGKPARSKGWCRTHSNHVIKYGEPMPIGSLYGKRGHRCQEPGCDERTTRKFCVEHLPTAGQQCEALDCTDRALGGTPYCPVHARTDRTLRHSYGISLRQRDRMVVQQGHRCRICDEVAPLHVDHCHDTGKVRGMLCGPCNRAIGLLRHDPTIISGALAYLGGE